MAITGTTDTYIREQLLTRRERLSVVIAARPAAAQTTRFQELLSEVDAALERMGSGSYGICEVCDETIIFLIGDVSGKGVAASLLMSYLRATFRSLSSARLDINKLLEAANRLFCESTMAGQFATLVCGRAARDGSVQIASAGHCPVLVASRSGVKQIYATGLPLGMFANSHFTAERIDLSPGDSLLLYTDGLSEARDAQGSEYGIENISRFVQDSFQRTPRELVAGFLNAVRLFSSGITQADDQTLMVIRRTASSLASQSS